MEWKLQSESEAGKNLEHCLREKSSKPPKDSFWQNLTKETEQLRFTVGEFPRTHKLAGLDGRHSNLLYEYVILGRMSRPEAGPDFKPILSLLAEQSYSLSMAGMDLERSRLGSVNRLSTEVLTGVVERKIGLEELLPLRVIYFWAWQVANDKSGDGIFSYADTDVGRPVAEIAKQLEDLVDSGEAERIWNELKSSPEGMARYFLEFRLRVRDKLR